MLGRIDANRQLAGEYDAGLLWSGLLLLGLGLVMLGNVLVFRKPKPVLAETRA